VNKEEVLQKKVSSSVDCLVDDDHEELASLQKELESLHPSDFKASEAETIALTKLVSFRLVETNNLEIAPPSKIGNTEAKGISTYYFEPNQTC
jgi:hypothetical protein